MNTSDLHIEIYDIEVFHEMTLYCGYNKQDGKNYQYEISSRKNEIDGLVKHLVDRNFQYGVGYNNVGYDGQVLQFILENHEKWFDKTAMEVIKLISGCSQDIIDRQNYENIGPLYKEWELDIKQIDLFRVHHYDNKNRRVGLKTLEFAMDLQDIEEMPFSFKKKDLTHEEMDMVIRYCWNDVEATKTFWDITIGNTDNENYKDKDKIQDRLDLIEDMGFKLNCLNWSDAKIGDEVGKKGYMQETGCSYDDIYKKRRDRKQTPKFTYGDCIPKYIKFKSAAMNTLYNTVKDVVVSLAQSDKQEFPVTYGNTTYAIMRGGIHSRDGKRIVTPPVGCKLIDADISSQYPNAINKRNLYPAHLGPKWNVNYEKTIYKRLDYKAKGKTDRKYKGLSEMYKLCLNGVYGKTKDATNWQYDPKLTFTCTIGNQFEILMLIEMLEDVGIQVVTANTDGFTSIVPEDKEQKYYQICQEWEIIVGNDKIGKLEYIEYKKIVQTSVNDYLAIEVGGKIKTKGDFNVDVELHKNKSNRIVPIALREWYVNGIPVEETVKNCKDIWKFVIGCKSSNDYYYQGIDRKTGKTVDYKKLVRYYCASEGEKLYKVKHEHSEKTGRPRSRCESGSDHQILINRYWKPEKWEDYHIDYQYYIEEIYKMKDQLEKEAARDRKEKAAKLQTLF